jgi:ATP-dependent Clp protease ATP-binding subunit ClpA
MQIGVDGYKRDSRGQQSNPSNGQNKRKKVMRQLHISLDPARVGPDTTSLQRALRAMIIGQDEAINHIVDVYQMYVTGLTAMAQVAQAGVGPF